MKKKQLKVKTSVRAGNEGCDFIQGMYMRHAIPALVGSAYDAWWRDNYYNLGTELGCDIEVYP